ncbi:hypothetical protein EMCRGX_G022820 [Ephydatia muelleri]
MLDPPQDEQTMKVLNFLIAEQLRAFEDGMEVSYLESDCCLRLVPSKSTHARDKANEYLPSCTSFIQYEIGPEIDSARLLALRNKPFAAAEHTWLSYLEPEYHKCNSEKCEARTDMYRYRNGVGTSVRKGKGSISRVVLKVCLELFLWR